MPGAGQGGWSLVMVPLDVLFLLALVDQAGQDTNDTSGNYGEHHAAIDRAIVARADRAAASREFVLAHLIEAAAQEQDRKAQVRALELLGRHLGMFAHSRQVAGQGDIVHRVTPRLNGAAGTRRGVRPAGGAERGKSFS